MNAKLILVISLFIPILLFAQNTEKLNIITYNVRYDNPEDGKDNWKYRKDSAAKLIRELNTDILCTQEILNSQLTDLLGLLPEFSYFGVGRSDGKTKGEYAAVFYRKDKYELEKSGNFWLSPNPDSVASVGWDAALERIVSWGVLKNKKSGRQFVVFNTHFDHQGKIARRESAQLLLNKIKEIAGNLPVIVSGDFNGSPESEPIQIIRKSVTLSDASLITESKQGVNWTFHGFGNVPEEDRESIDFVFLSKDFKVKLYNSIYKEIGNTYYSDHNPVFVSLEFIDR